MAKISKEERQALKWVRDALAKRSNLKGTITADRCIKNNVIPAAAFLMDQICENEACGTIGCIGGWMGLKMFDGNRNMAWDYVYDVELDHPLYGLFYNYADPDHLVAHKHATRSMAIQAIDKVLKGKHKDPWKGITY